MRRTAPLLVLPLLAAGTAHAVKRQPEPDSFAIAETLVRTASDRDEAGSELRILCDRIGPRMAGTPGYDAAVAWALEAMRQDGLAVHEEPVQVPRWVRGEERVELLAPHARALASVGLGLTIGTPPEGIEADVLVVTSFEELSARAAEARGRIVLFDAPWGGYGPSVRFRSRGAEEAARVGAVGVLIRSVTSSTGPLPHTGMVRREPGVPTVPAAALGPSEASALRRLAEAGVPVRVRMRLGARDEGAIAASTVVGELRGRTRPDEIVLLGCHLDSWDVGPGAQDDATGCVAVMDAAALLAELPVRPRRTVRVVLFAAEETGVHGGRAYAAAHASDRIVAAMELDAGSGPVTGLGLDLRDRATGQPDPAALERARARLAPFAPLLEGLGIATVGPGGSGADVGGLVAGGAMGASLVQDTSGYWPVHHAASDTPETVDPGTLRRITAATALVAWILADLPERVDAP